MNDLLIPKPSYFSWKECLWFLDRGYDDCLFQIEGNTITRVVNVQNQPYLIRISEQKKNLVIECLNSAFTPEAENGIQIYTRAWFDMDRNIHPFFKLLRMDPVLSFLAEKYKGLRLIGIPDLHECLSWCIIGQQINLSFAYRLKRRLVENFGIPFHHGGKTYYQFPDPGVLADLVREDLLALQFSRQKADYIIHISRLIASGSLSLPVLKELDHYETMLEHLTAIRGIGIWTANYVLMKSLKMMNSIPYGDIGLKKALQQIYGLDVYPDDRTVREYFKPYSGWEAYLVFYFWRTLS